MRLDDEEETAAARDSVVPPTTTIGDHHDDEDEEDAVIVTVTATTPARRRPGDPAAGGVRCPVHRESSAKSDTTATSTGTGTTASHSSSLHRHLPALRRHDHKAATIRQHYYTEGGWGWIVCACAFLVHVLCGGTHFAYGMLYLEVLQHFGPDYVIEAGWLGTLSFAVSLLVAPLVVAVCRRKSTRLTAVLGGLVTALGCLFTSFAQQPHQTFLSYGLVLGAGIGLCRETANLMVGQYFKRRRECVEMLVQTGSGIGTALFSVFFREAIGAVGWRLGLQAVTGVLFSGFILGLFYRSASLYHPQRRAILHIKTQKKKVKDKGRPEDKKPAYFDFTTLKTHTLQVIMLSAGVSALGVYTPIFYLAVHCKQEGLDAGSIVLLQTFVGFAFALGTLGFGLVVVRQSEECVVARQYLCQASLVGLAAATLALASVRGYHGYVLVAWMYGVCLGGYHFSLKVHTFEKMRARHFARAWGFVQWAKALPVLFGVPIAGYINQGHSSKSGFYFSCAFTLAGASCLFLENVRQRRMHRKEHTVTFGETNHLPHLHHHHHLQQQHPTPSHFCPLQHLHHHHDCNAAAPPSCSCCLHAAAMGERRLSRATSADGLDHLARITEEGGGDRVGGVLLHPEDYFVDDGCHEGDVFLVFDDEDDEDDELPVGADDSEPVRCKHGNLLSPPVVVATGSDPPSDDHEPDGGSMEAEVPGEMASDALTPPDAAVRVLQPGQVTTINTDRPRTPRPADARCPGRPPRIRCITVVEEMTTSV